MEWKWLSVVLVAFLLGRCCECEGCWEQEKIALLQLKPFFTHITDVKNYWVEEGKQSLDCCQWKRVECNNSTGRVIRLFLNLTTTEVYRGLVHSYYGEYDWIEKDHWYLNASLFLPFEELKSLYLGGNSIIGCVGNEGFERLSSKLDKLEILDLSVNQFNDNILASLSELSSLKSLNLAKNQFTGSNPANGMKRLSKLNKLKTLDLHDNVLGNNILSHLDDFTSLKSLLLQNCGIKGMVDLLELNSLMNLKELYLGQNQIESLGFLFQSKGQLKLIKLEVLGLSENLFNNSIFSSLAALSNLKSLYIGFNKLEGPIHIKELNALSNLVELDMRNNEVNYFVPSQDNETKLRLINLEVLDLRWNLFNCSILSSLGRLSNLKSLSFGGNNLEGSIDLRDALSNLENLFISCNDPNGTRACSLPPQSLELFPSLKTLSFYGFSFYGTLTTQWQILTSLEELVLENSSLSSYFIQDIEMLIALKNLYVFSCELNDCLNLQGPLHLKNLETLVIQDTSLENNFIEKIGVMPSLKILKLSDCGLNGTIQTQGFCEMRNLQNLDVSGNNLKGNLPECFSNLTFLENLDLSSNQFSGSISTLKSLTSLERLDLSSNQFSGDISALRSLKSLGTLSLSNNYFEIPSSLGPLFNLSKLQSIFADNNTIYAETEMHFLAPTFQLNEISMSCCGDAGSFPRFLYHQQDLVSVDLSNIYFKVEKFPIWLLENNTKLETLILSNSSLSGPLLLPLAPHLGLSEFDISNNFFNGSIPVEIGAKLPSLSFLNMSKNHFGDSIPDSIGDMNSIQTLDLSNNNLTGGVPEPWPWVAPH
ncbi:receptor-like protein 12 isoform X2 [Durio zibethinus]|uniref:Receptor-like protein 12 isoform X2 n=1 Tax=Durio zibethinus TaxID=66656 RepID=A0A6P5ZR59_DURZI|nr:receptor-like protein 12 isoform X2 [Durio zibethinus]